jgi:hypothetical protein
LPFKFAIEPKKELAKGIKSCKNSQMHSWKYLVKTTVIATFYNNVSHKLFSNIGFAYINYDFNIQNLKEMRNILIRNFFPHLWMIFALSLFYTNLPDTENIHNLVTLLAVLTYIFTLANWIQKGNRLFSIFTIFILFSLFFNLGQSILYSFTDFPLLWSIYDIYSLSDICYMLKYQFICAAGLYLGSSIYIKTREHRVSLEDFSSFYKTNNNSNLHKQSNIILTILLYVSLSVTFYFTIYQLTMRQNMSYSELYVTRNTISEYYSFGAIVLGLYFIFIKKHVKIVLGAWIWFFIAFNIAGTRSMGVIYMGALTLVLPTLYPHIFKKKYIAIWIIGLVLGLISFSIISDYRQGELGNSKNGNLDFMISLYKAINEMGISETPTLTTINSIKQGDEHTQTILYNIILGIIPADLLNEFVPKEWTNVSLGAWATEQEKGITFTSALGYSWIAEAYMNYGAWGWIFTMIYGYFIAFAENFSLRRIMQGRYLLAICLIAILCKQIFFARAQLNLVMSFYKPTIYILMFLFVFGIKQRQFK